MSTDVTDVIGSPSSTEGSSASTNATPPAASSPASDTATSSADVNTQPAVQGQSSEPQSQTQTDGQSDDDPLAGFPPDEELQAAVANKTPWAEMASRLKGAYSPLKQTLAELTAKFSPYESVLERFEQPEQLQQIVQLHDGLLGWDSDPDTGAPIPATEKGAEFLNTNYPVHADFLAADLLNQTTRDPDTGQPIARIDLTLKEIAKIPEERAKALSLLGGVDPSSVTAPQWQPTAEELAVVKPELQDVFRKLPYEERKELSENTPEFINRFLEREKFQQELVERDKQTQAQAAQQLQQRETYINQQAQQAANEYVNSQLNSALATFHESVVKQCDFIKPIDVANLPQGMTAEQAAQANQQIAASNKAEAAQITGLIVSLFNPQTKEYVLPLLREIGAVDDKLLSQLDAAASNFGNNGRHYGNLTFRQKLTSGPNYQPDAAITQMSNEASRALKTMVGLANQIKGRLLERRSQFFSLSAQQHNQTLNGAASVRPPVNGTGYDPTSAPPSKPQGWMSRAEIEQLASR